MRLTCATFPVILATIAILAWPAVGLAQVNHGAVVFSGLFADEFKSPAGEHEGESFPVDTFSPGLEYRTNPRGRISWGIGYNRQNVPLFTIAEENLVTDPNFGVVAHYRTEDIFEAKLDVFSVTAYIHVLTENLVQPFVGIGGGVGIARVDGTFVFMDLLNPQFSSESDYSEKTYDMVLRGVAGASYFPIERVVVSGGGGYQNGGAGFFQVGVVF